MADSEVQDMLQQFFVNVPIKDKELLRVIINDNFIVKNEIYLRKIKEINTFFNYNTT